MPYEIQIFKDIFYIQKYIQKYIQNYILKYIQNRFGFDVALYWPMLRAFLFDDRNWAYEIQILSFTIFLNTFLNLF